jgi:hypothetical protein
MGWEDVKVNPSSLAIVKRQATGIETRYMLERLFLPLKKKYRPTMAALSQWGCGGDYSGKTNKKKGNNTAARAKVANKPMIMRVNAGTGHTRMEEVK